jgi:hypothetical protein
LISKKPLRIGWLFLCEFVPVLFWLEFGVLGMKEIFAGDGFGVNVSFNADYDVKNSLSDMRLYFNGVLVGELDAANMPPTAAVNTYHCVINGAMTANLRGNYFLQLEIVDSILGMQVLQAFVISVMPGSAVNGNSSTINDVSFILQIYDSYVVMDVELVAAYSELSAYEVAVENGYEGSAVVYAETSQQTVIAVSITNKKDGDVVAHGLNGEVLILGFISAGSQKVEGGFSAETVDASSFVLRTGLFGALADTVFSGYLVICRFKVFV